MNESKYHPSFNAMERHQTKASSIETSAKNSYQKDFATIKRQMIVDVEFGMPSKSCKKYGICRVHVLKAFTPRLDKATAVVSIFDNGDVSFDFFKTSISYQKYKKYFASGIFKVKECFTFNNINDSSYNFKIVAGEYFIIKSEGLITVQFSASQD